MPVYRHTFQVNAPLEAVRDFHAQSASMGAITPPPVIVQLRAAPAILNEGDEMAFTLWIGPIPVRWLARIEQVTLLGFVDRQLTGPFQSWAHRHAFEGVDPQTTIVKDEVQAAFKRHWFWGPFGWGMWLSLPLLFAYRGWATRRRLHTQ